MAFPLRVRWLQIPAFVLSLACISAPGARPSEANAAGNRPSNGQPSADPGAQSGARPGASEQPSAGSSTTPAPGVESGRTIRFGDATKSGERAPFFPGTVYDPNVPTPDSLLRQPLGTFTAHHAEIVAAMRAMEAKSARLKVVPFGRTHEGRELVYVIVASPENLRNVDAIRADLGKLADPRQTDAAEADRIVKSSPAVAWLGYSIHGDEMSGSDASVAVAYHFAAGTSADVTDILKQVVIVIDPMLNPDGRERILSQLEQNAGYVPNLDSDSMSRGRWPYGRGNHYLFDMNRDWPFGTQPETRARWAAITSFHPQLLVDAHEMGALDTFLFYPATEPFTNYFPDATKKWWQAFGNDEAAAFDRHGWSYYTREWADSWYPGYSDSWGTFIGAVGILYEQARFLGQSTRRASGEIATYREAVQRQATGSIANVTTLAKNREAILHDYLAAKQKNVAADTPGNDRMLVLVPGRNADREAKLVRMLSGQGIEVFRADAGFTGKHVETTLKGKKDEQAFPTGSLLIPARQPLSPMVKAYLEFDPRYDKGSLNRERKELERKQRSKVYDVTAWSPGHAFDVDAFWCDEIDVQKTAVTDLPARAKGIVALTKPDEPVYGWVVDGVDDAAVVFAAQAMELGLQVEIGDDPFSIFDGGATKGADGKPSTIAPEKSAGAGSEKDAAADKGTANGKTGSVVSRDKSSTSGRTFARGSLLVRRHENGADVAAKVAQAADTSGARVFATGTAHSHDEGPDLGGHHFKLLARPRVAVLSNAPVDTDSFGHVWHMLDVHLGLPCTLLDAQQLASYDLRRYNVIVLPEGGIGAILKANADALRTWMKSGGTLIASGGSAVAVADKDLKLTSVKLRDDALEDLEKLAISVKRERDAGKKPVDEAELWGDAVEAAGKSGKSSGEKTGEQPGDKSKVDSSSSTKPAGDKNASGDTAVSNEKQSGGEADSGASDKDKSSDKSDTKSQKSDKSTKSKDKRGDKDESDEDSDKKRRERWLRTFSPRGVILRGEVNLDSWLTFGCSEEIPVFFEGSSVFLSELPVRTPVRFAAADRLRLSGLLWPEARERIADSAYATIESQGSGQVILFASPPAFRDWFKGTERLLMNAIVYGPGAGASQPVGW